MNFMGYKRPDGSVGIRNHVLILPGCACASETCRVVASQVSGAVNIINNSGCAEVKGNEDHGRDGRLCRQPQRLRRRSHRPGL